MLNVTCFTYFLACFCCHTIFIQGFHASWKVLDFSLLWKVLENDVGPGKSWKLKFKVLDTPEINCGSNCMGPSLDCHLLKQSDSELVTRLHVK